MLKTIAKVWKLLHSLFVRYSTPFSQNTFFLDSGFLLFLELQKSLQVSFQGCWTQWQRFKSSSIHHFWDTLQYFLKIHFCLDSGFLLFLELQKSLQVSFQGCWIQWQRFENSSIHCLWDTLHHFLKIHFCLDSGFRLFLESPEITTIKFAGVLNTMAKVWKL